MPNQAVKIGHKQEETTFKRSVVPATFLLFALAMIPTGAPGNLLENPGFEVSPGSGGGPPSWKRAGANAASIMVTEKDAHEGRRCVAIPPGSAIEQRIENAEAGAYQLRCWVKSDADQPVTLVIQDSDRPWEAYSWTKVPTPKNQWTQLKAFCVLDRKGPLMEITLGGMPGGVSALSWCIRHDGCIDSDGRVRVNPQRASVIAGQRVGRKEGIVRYAGLVAPKGNGTRSFPPLSRSRVLLYSRLAIWPGLFTVPTGDW